MCRSIAKGENLTFRNYFHSNRFRVVLVRPVDPLNHSARKRDLVLMYRAVVQQFFTAIHNRQLFAQPLCAFFQSFPGNALAFFRH